MTDEGRHYSTRYAHELSPRQREVMERVARGRTNGQIAEDLGITLDGVKWHVSEILQKLGVSTREEAAERWRGQQRPWRRAARRAGLLAPLLGRKVLGAAAVVLVGVVGVVLIVLALGGDDSDAIPITPDATVFPTPTPSPSPEPEGTVPSMLRPTPEAPIVPLNLAALPPIRAIWLAVVNHPYHEELPVPMDGTQSGDAAVIATIATWLGELEPTGEPAYRTLTGPPFETLLVLFEDGRVLRASRAWDCPATPGGTTCTRLGGRVDVSWDGEHWERPWGPDPFLDWFQYGRAGMRMASPEDGSRAWQALLAGQTAGP